MVNTDTDLDAVLGKSTSVLKTQVEAAKVNAGQNWNACVFVLDGVLTWKEAVDYVMEQKSVEGFVLTDPITESTEVEAMQTKQAEVMAEYMRPTVFLAAFRKLNSLADTWATYIKAVVDMLSGLRAETVSVVPYLWGHELGTYVGRLCNRAVTVADSPMRVATGNLLGEWANKPQDMLGRPVDRSILKALADARFDCFRRTGNSHRRSLRRNKRNSARG
ncbi:DUF2586 family protein [Halodesulfovibrio sp.]|jgi:hypothetical protein|uniref:DUF2586 family protein n=1 Tax=Halodesulfovibrio sp. TaxID=1912772 RepID=UPI0025CE010C|nr:DUF2586 family protein [Halodesulfovibrio sp.]MCT4627964.1 DUF2586 domain-containing protein [Halodesulfovibrio sp.]